MIPEQEGVPFNATTEFNQRLDLIRHLIRNSDRILLVRGDSGLGKSTLLAYLQRLADQEWSICRIDATPMLQPDALLHQLAERFEIDASGDDLFGALVRRMDDLHQGGRLPLILVDDAHALPVPSLILLFRIHEHLGQGGLPLRLVLFARPEVDDLLRSPQLRAMESATVQRVELTPLDLRQTERFVRQILQVEGGGAAMPSAARLARLHRDSGGHPGEVERLTRRFLSGGAEGAAAAGSPPPRRTVAGLSLPAAAAIALVAVALLLTLIFQDRINALFQGEGEPSAAGDGQVVSLALPPQQTTAEKELPLPESQEPAPQSSEEEQAIEPFVEPVVPADGAPEVTPPELTLPETVPVESEVPVPADATQPIAAAESPEPAGKPTLPSRPEPPEAGARHVATEETVSPVPEKQTPAAPAPSPKESVSPHPVGESGPPAAAPPTPKTKPAAPVSPAPAEPPVPVRDLSSTGGARAKSSVPATTVKPAPAPVEERGPAPTPPPATPRPAANGPRDEAWLLKRPPGHYTLQLVGVQDEKAARAFIRRHRLSGPVAYFRTSRNGKPWYPVVYGDYPSRDAAVAARDHLPGRLARSGAWPRTFASVQEAIRQR